MNKCADITIRGQVQGVFFRVSAQHVAESLQLRGFVRNLQDGTVHSVADGELEKLLDYIKWCHIGPEAARVDEIHVKFRSPLNTERKFKIV
ncbi:MAG: acylphosphatase [Gammaproteobacteria bacterium]|nr:acylphosphatase [Gammaproteobacteria bacterium]